jgi:hypothetical protein
MPDRNTVRESLLREGLKSYFDAMTAIDEFTRLIQEDCRKVLQRHADALNEATGLKFSPKEISDYSDPYNGRGKVWSGQYASIGSMLPVPKSDKFYSMDAGLTWDQEDGPQSPYFIPVFTRRISLCWTILNQSSIGILSVCMSTNQTLRLFFGVIGPSVLMVNTRSMP